MKKFIAFTAAAFVSVTLLAGCGAYSKPAGSTGGNVGNNGGNNDPVNNDTKFKVTLVYDGKPYTNTDGLSAQWSDGIGKTSSPFNSEGVAETTGLNGDYRVTLSGLDTSFTYNPNIYFATNDEPDVEIEIYSVSTIKKGKGVSYNEYEITNTGYYRATFKDEAQAKSGIMFLYVPTRTGKYSIESIVDITANEVNPMVVVYGGSRYYIMPNPVTYDTGGSSASYTKNFRYEVQRYEGEIGEGNVFRFSVKFNSRSSDIEYPFNIDFRISYDGEAVNEDPLYKTEKVEVTEDFAARKAQIPNWDQTGKKWTSADNDKKFIGENFKFNEEDGLWHVWDGTNFGEVLWAKINGDSDILAPENAGLGFMHPLVSKNNLNGYNYDNFVETYAQHTNNIGCYPVTAEVKVFLQNYAVSQRYFMDGKGWAEFMGYKSMEEDQWLFNCGYYKD